MLLYEYRVRDAFKQITDYAEGVRRRFAAEATAEDLLAEAENLAALWENLKSVLPKEIRSKSSIERHLAWMKGRLRQGLPQQCRSDIEDICNNDIPALETGFREWCKSKAHYDSELAEKTTELVAHHELDSAVRKAFVILTARLRSTFEVSDNADGPELVNRIFGKNGRLTAVLDESKRQSTRDLLAGLYGVFRNKFAHRDEEIEWWEAEAVLSMINFALKEIDRIVSLVNTAPES